MGFVSWLKGLFAKKPPARDVSMSAGEEDVDLVEERVDTSGGPMKEGHRRLALRDPRLLPKEKTKRTWPPKKRPKLMDGVEANRLFSTTMRTRNRRLRDLVTDADQLARYGLPLWESERDLARDLELSLGELRHFSIHRQRERASHYVTFEIPKRSGGTRLIMAPKRRLKAIQRSLKRLLVDKLPVSDSAHGFVATRSVRTGAEPHVGKRVVVRMDLESFFPSVHVGRVRGLLIAYGYSYPVATCLAVLMTEAERQPVDVDGSIFHVPVGHRHCVQGAPTSPGLCNAILLRFDRRMAGLARAKDMTYTRYADDLVFSGDDAAAVAGLLVLVEKIAGDEGFRVRRDKTRVMRAGTSQKVTGVTVNRELGLSRKERRVLRAALHREKSGGLSAQEAARLRGRLAYLHMLNAEQARRLGSRT